MFCYFLSSYLVQWKLILFVVHFVVVVESRLIWNYDLFPNPGMKYFVRIICREISWCNVSENLETWATLFYYFIKYLYLNFAWTRPACKIKIQILRPYFKFLCKHRLKQISLAVGDLKMKIDSGLWLTSYNVTDDKSLRKRKNVLK
jgi:hypothetical protein